MKILQNIENICNKWILKTSLDINPFSPEVWDNYEILGGGNKHPRLEIN